MQTTKIFAVVFTFFSLALAAPMPKKHVDPADKVPTRGFKLFDKLKLKGYSGFGSA
ncbi:hypothetical protein TWF481_000377 [Arthrobotrys musiformis]|uniref:Uncharacterized protein n=1 Tax=Arthrobotrys musiformis TaxID=47236 RepID=A0AAV9WML1_9PEZI